MAFCPEICGCFYAYVYKTLGMNHLSIDFKITLKNLVNLSDLYNDVLVLQYQTKTGRFAKKKKTKLSVVVSKRAYSPQVKENQ